MNLNLKRMYSAVTGAESQGECWTCMGNCTMWIMGTACSEIKELLGRGD
ncbi:MAG: hypothetical protein ACLSHX_17835 [Suilimivivens sp.]